MGEVSKADWSWINQAADQFERACKAGARPRIEDFLARATDGRRGPLSDELLRVECEIRRARARNRPRRNIAIDSPSITRSSTQSSLSTLFDPSGWA